MKNRWSKWGVRAYQMGKWSATEGQLQRQTCVARIPSFYLKTQSPFSSCHFNPPIFISTLPLSFQPSPCHFNPPLVISTLGRNLDLWSRTTIHSIKPKLESRSPKHIQILKNKNACLHKSACSVWNIRIFDFGFVSNFDIRVSSWRQGKSY